MKKNTPPKQQNGWLVLFLIFLTLAVFLMVLLQNIPSVATKTGLVVTPAPPVSIVNKYLTLKGEKVERPQLFILIQIWLNRFFESVSQDLGAGKKLGKLTVREVQLANKNFLLYDAKLQPEKKGFIVRLTIDPPQMLVRWKDQEEYTKFYPSLNPYIHALELEYIWVWTGKPEFNLVLSKLDFQMVDWKDNAYNKNYKDTKNSPLYRMCIPEPHNWSKQELLIFLTTMGLFNKITVVQTDLEVSDIQGSPVERKTTA